MLLGTFSTSGLYSSSLLLSSPNTPQTQQLCCNKNLQMQVPHKAGNSPMYLPLNNVYHYDINTEKIINQSQRGALPTVFPKNANANIFYKFLSMCELSVYGTFKVQKFI
jgi:hypothetical protein